MDYKDYLKWIASKGYSENSFTYWKFKHQDMTNYAISQMFNLPQCNLKLWQCTDEKRLVYSVRALFRVMNKVDLCGIDTTSLF